MSSEPKLYQLLGLRGYDHVIQVYKKTQDRNESTRDFGPAMVSIHAGTAVELVCKSIVAEVHPSLILEEPWKALHGLNDLHRLPGHTATASLMLATVADTPGIGGKSSIVYRLGMLLLGARNSAAHAGYTRRSRAETQALLAVWLTSVFEIEKNSPLKILGCKGHEWKVIESRADKIEAEAIEKVELAKASYDIKITKLSEKPSLNTGEEKRIAESETLAPLALWKKMPELFSEKNKPAHDATLSNCGIDAALQDCPACGNKTPIYRALVDVETEYEGPGEYSQYAVYEYGIICNFCSLVLSPDYYYALGS